MNLSERYYEKIHGTIKNTEINLDNILLQLEVTNACNHRCNFCPNQSSTRPIKMIDLDFAKRIISECSSFLGKNKKICFHMNGEPLLYKGLTELVSFSKSKGFDYIFLTTNGAAATDDLLTNLFDAGLDSLKFSINAGSPETYEKIHGKNDFNKVIHALQFSDEYRKKNNREIKIFVSCVGTVDNHHELKQLKDLVDPFCDEVVFYYPCGYAGQNNKLSRDLRYDMSDLDLKTFDIIHNCPCNVLWNSINVTCEGYLSLCCSESDNRLVIEDLNKTTVKEAWLGRKMNEIRHKHMISDISDLPCHSCISGSDYFEENMNKDLLELAINARNNRKRIKNKIEKIDYDSTQNFFQNRALKYNSENPYSVTMYQDNHPELVAQRNAAEIRKLKPMLGLDSNSKVLDVACGIGRWSDSISENITEYCGVDFSSELIRLAKERNCNKPDRDFIVGSASEIENVLKESGKSQYNVILLIGILMYINENELLDMLMQIERAAEDHAVICIREPVGIEERLTLKEFYSQELQDNYNAIYRTDKELKAYFEKAFLSKGFRIEKEGFLFDDRDLNNRKETEQYYYILRR